MVPSSAFFYCAKSLGLFRSETAKFWNKEVVTHEAPSRQALISLNSPDANNIIIARTPQWMLKAATAYSPWLPNSRIGGIANLRSEALLPKLRTVTSGKRHYEAHC